MLVFSIKKRVFHFKKPSGTSRGVMTKKKSWFVQLWTEDNPEITGEGECSIIEGLSPDFQSPEQYEEHLQQVLENFVQRFRFKDLISNTGELESFFGSLEETPSILCGLEMAILDLVNGEKSVYFHSDFVKRKQGIPINGLIWMGSRAFIEEQIQAKIEEGFKCIKMKIGAMDFQSELGILAAVRKKYLPSQIELRVDANGAFSIGEAPEKLKELSKLIIHSIEQPIQVGNWSEMGELCRQSPLPIALDEELIGINGRNKKIELLQAIMPGYLVLKPSLHGGFRGCREWIELAEKFQIQWWLTSALESNLGLNAISQFASSFNNPLYQGLGTGSLFVENVKTDLVVQKGYLFRS